MTTRHLADAIGYSQPVLYGHFPGGKVEIMLAIAAVAHSYLDFAEEHPAGYEAMFRQPIDARFAEEGNEMELRESDCGIPQTGRCHKVSAVVWAA